MTFLCKISHFFEDVFQRFSYLIWTIFIFNLLLKLIVYSLKPFQEMNFLWSIDPIFNFANNSILQLIFSKLIIHSKTIYYFSQDISFNLFNC